MSKPLRIVTWNINSIRLRVELVRKLVEEKKPDILCLQETKVDDNAFPGMAMHSLGFHYQLFRGEKSYNGVAILSRIPLHKTTHQSFGGNNDCRHLQVVLPQGITLHNFYVPAGGDIPEPQLNRKFAHKLAFMDDLRTFFSSQDAQCPSILVGDLNIAPLPNDVWSHNQLLGVVSHTPIEVEKMQALQETCGWVDTHRIKTPPEQKLYSWWSYRNSDWKKSDRGRRLDHIWVTPSLAESVVHTEIIKSARDWEKPSDHVPVITDLAV